MQEPASKKLSAPEPSNACLQKRGRSASEQAKMGTQRAMFPQLAVATRVKEK